MHIGILLLSRSVWPQGLQHAWPPCPLLSPGVWPSSCPLNSDAIQPSHPLSSPLLLPSIFPSIRIFSNESVLHIGWTEYWSFSFSISPSLQDWFPLGLTGWISLQSKRLSRVFSNTTLQKHLGHSAFFIVQISHPYMNTGKTTALTRWTFVGKVMALPFNMLSRLVVTFLPSSKCLLISWLQSPSAVILEPKK